MTGDQRSWAPGEEAAERDRLRREGRAARRSVSGQNRLRAERLIGAHLTAMTDGLLTRRSGQGSSAAQVTVGVFDPDDGEPSLDAYVADRRTQGVLPALPNIEIRAGKSGDRAMRFIGWHDGDTLTEGRFGIRYPTGGQPVDPSVVIIPLVRFDLRGNRLGRGAGFYDRWLSAHTCHRIGVGFENQRASQIPAASHDVPLDAVVTELGIRLIAS